MRKFKHVIAALLLAPALSTASVMAGDGELKHHIFGLFGGVTTNSHATKATIGLEYEYRVNKIIGFGAVYEKTPNYDHGHDMSIIMVQAHLHPWKELRVSLGFGEESVHGHKADVWRVGAAYDFHVGNFGIAPTYAIDRINGHTSHVIGLALVKAF